MALSRKEIIKRRAELRRKRRKKEKKGKIIFHFGAHVFPTDFKASKLGRVFSKAKNIYLEMVTHPSKYEDALKMFKELKSKKIKPEDARKPDDLGFGLELFKKIYGRKRLRLWIEPPSEMGDMESVKEIVRINRKSFKLFEEGKFDEATDKRDEFQKIMHHGNMIRNRLILEDLIKRHEQYPYQDIHVIIGLEGHSILAKKLKEKGIPVRMKLSQKKVLMSPLSEILRRQAYGKKMTEEQKRKLLAADFISARLLRYLHEERGIEDSIKSTTIARRVVDRLSEDEIREISKYLSKQSRILPEVPLTESESANLIVHWLKKKGKTKKGEL